MKNSHSESYAAAGVDVTAGYEAVERIKSHGRVHLHPRRHGHSGRLRRLCLPPIWPA